MDVKQARIANLKRLIGDRRGAQAAFAKKHSLSAAHISQILSGHRDMGDKYARGLEKLLELEHGSMDHAGAQLAKKSARDARLSPEATDIAIAWQKLPPTRQQAFRDSIFLEAVVATSYPWLVRGRPQSESYNDFEKSMERDIVRITKRLMMEDGKKL
jgi:hypothetical protein